MRDPLTISLRGIEPSEELQACIAKEARRLASIGENLVGCVVIAEKLENDARQGVHFAARLIVTLPGAEVVVNREDNADILKAMRAAFAAAAQQLRDQVQRRPERRTLR